MAAVYIKNTIDFKAFDKSFIKASDDAIVFTATKALTLLKNLQPIGKTGELQKEVGIKFFKQKNKMLGASLQVIGERYKVSVILEYGTKDTRILARHTFEKAATSLASFIETTYINVFFTELEAIGNY